MPWVTRSDDPKPDPSPAPAKPELPPPAAGVTSREMDDMANRESAVPMGRESHSPGLSPGNPGNDGNAETGERLAERSRQNGAKSRGPVTEKGKERVSQNALKHGRYASDAMLISSEDPKEFKSFRAQMCDHLRPSDPVQQTLVDRIVTAAWRLRRCARAEAEDIEYEMEPDRFKRGSLGRYVFFGNSGQYIDLSRYESAVERSMYKALQALARLQSAAAEKMKKLGTNPE